MEIILLCFRPNQQRRPLQDSGLNSLSVNDEQEDVASIISNVTSKILDEEKSKENDTFDIDIPIKSSYAGIILLYPLLVD